MKRAHLHLILPALLATACADTLGSEDAGPDAGLNNNTNNNTATDAGTPQCPDPAPFAATRCDTPGCETTTGTKAFAIADLNAADSQSWTIVSWVASELFDNETVALDYARATSGGLTARRRAVQRQSLRERLGEDAYQVLYGPKRQGKLQGEHLIWANAVGEHPARGPSWTRIQDRSRDFLPPGAHKQDTACSRSNTDCGNDAVCVLDAPDQDTGTCTANLSVIWRDQSNPGQSENIDTTVAAAGQRVALLVENGTTLDDAAELLRRVEDHILPIDHALFGEPGDIDGNGKVLFLFTPRVGQIADGLVGFFQTTDLQDPAQAPTSNRAEILYVEPPGAGVSLDQVSGTIAHEYQHLTNYYAKVIERSSSQEARWLDEGLSSFAEDITGYGADAFKNVAAYLGTVNETSLTGFGLLYDNENDADSAERRGAAHLLIRYVFEQAGGATFGDEAGSITDNGGVAAVRRLVQDANTGMDLFTEADSGRTWSAWVGSLLTTVALDGTDYPDVSCNTRYQLAPPEEVTFTSYPRGVDLRTSMADFDGETIPLAGPTSAPTFENENVPVPGNGGEIRTLTVSGQTTVSVGGDAEGLADYEASLNAIPTALTP